MGTTVTSALLRRGRGKAVVDEALHSPECERFQRYHHYDGPKQRCWAHLQSNLVLPQGHLCPPVRTSSTSRPGFHPSSGTTTAHRSTGLGASCWRQPFLADPLAVQACRHRAPHQGCLWRALGARSLRHLVISRKVSGGTRSERGTESKMTLAPSTRPPSRRLPPTAHFPPS